MIELGIFAKTFAGPLPTVFRAIQHVGIHRIQFNFSCAGLPSMPDVVDIVTRQLIQAALAETPLTIEAVSGTFNMIHPDLNERLAGLRRLAIVCQQCHWLNTNLITLCTGSRDAHNMWRAHSDNNRADAWYDLRQTLDRALEMAEQYGVIVGIEPETANVVNSVTKAAQLLREVDSPRLRIVFDPANLFKRESLATISDRITQGLDSLGTYIISAHAKDRNKRGEVVAAGLGILPYSDYLRGLKRIGYQGNLIAHGLAPNEVGKSVQFLRNQLERLEYV